MNEKPMYYRRDGTPYVGTPQDPKGTLQWAKDMENREYARVAETTLKDGTWISTVWIGLDHQFGEGKPLIFETMAFPSRTFLVNETKNATQPRQRRLLVTNGW
jgi:hypothetical protein